MSPEGRTAAVIGIGNGVRRVFLRRLDSTETTRSARYYRREHGVDVRT